MSDRGVAGDDWTGACIGGAYNHLFAGGAPLSSLAASPLSLLSVAAGVSVLIYILLVEGAIHSDRSSSTSTSIINQDYQISKMCTSVTSTTKYTGCPSSCNTTSTDLIKCQAALQSGTTCANPATSTLAASTGRTQCPNHRDEGFSQR